MLGAFLCMLCYVGWAAVAVYRGGDTIPSVELTRDKCADAFGWVQERLRAKGGPRRSRTNPLAAHDQSSVSSFTPPLQVPSMATPLDDPPMTPC